MGEYIQACTGGYLGWETNGQFRIQKGELTHGVFDIDGVLASLLLIGDHDPVG